MPARKFVVSGIVQGVGYRYFAVHAARARGVVGWVRNLPDGRVEVHAEGEEPVLSELEEDLRRGPRSAVVRSVQAIEEPASGRFSDFDVRY